MGMALDLWLHVQVSTSDVWEIEVKGVDCDQISSDVGENIIALEFIKTATERLGLKLNTRFKFSITNEIPLTRGLGSSASAIVSGIAAAFAMAGYDLQDPQILDRISLEAMLVEGHPDNVMPATHGGLQISLSTTKASVVKTRIPFPAEDLQCLVYIPHAPVSTSAARSILPSEYNREVCVRAISRAALFVATLLNRGPYSPNLRTCMDDEIHEPHRRLLCPDFDLIKRESHSSDKILAVFLSGAGPTTIILCTDVAHVTTHLLSRHPDLQSRGHFRSLAVIQSPLLCS